MEKPNPKVHLFYPNIKRATHVIGLNLGYAIYVTNIVIAIVI